MGLKAAAAKFFDTGLECAPLPAAFGSLAERVQRQIDAADGKVSGLTLNLLAENFKSKRVPIKNDFQIATEGDLKSIEEIFAQRSAPVGAQDPKKGFLRPTYTKDEIEKCIEDGLIQVIKDDAGKVQAFALVIADANSSLLSMERFALKLAQFFKKEDKSRILEDFKNDKIVYIAAFATRSDSLMDLSGMYKAIGSLADQYDDKTILLTCSFKPVPNNRMRILIEPCTNLIGQFSTPKNWGRPGLDGEYGGKPPKLFGLVPWIFGKWTSLIYEVDREKLGKILKRSLDN